MTATLDREVQRTVFVVTAVGRDGVRRDLWFGKSLRLAIKTMNVRLPEKFRSLYTDYALEERPLVP